MSIEPVGLFMDISSIVLNWMLNLFKLSVALMHCRRFLMSGRNVMPIRCQWDVSRQRSRGNSRASETDGTALQPIVQVRTLFTRYLFIINLFIRQKHFHKYA